MNNKINHIFSASDCSSEEVLPLYIKGKLSQAETHDIEAHLADCEMCSDYAEGLMLLPDPEKIKEITVVLNSRIDIITGKKPVTRFVNFRIITAVAAVLIVLLVAAFLVWKPFSGTHQSIQVAQKELDLSGQSTQIAEEESELLSESIITGKSWQKAAPPITSDMNIKDITGEQSAYRFAHSQTGQGQPKYFEDRMGQDSDVFMDETVAKLPEQEIVSDGYMESAKVEGQMKEELSMTRTTSTGSSAEKSDKISQAETLSTWDTDAGIQMYNEGRYESSLLYFENVLKIKPQEETAQWYYAMSVLKLGRTTEAKPLLTAIAKGSGKFRRQAAKELKKLGE
jgi:hypothetical protein